MIGLALSRPVSTLVGVAALAALGVLSLLQLPVSLLPEAERPSLIVIASAPDRSREEMLQGVTESYERRLMGVAGVSRMTSETEDGRLRIELVPDWQVDPSSLLVEVSRRIDGASAFPVSADVALASDDAAPIVEVAVRGGASAAWRSALARDVVRPELARLPGAGRVDVVGMSPAMLVVRPRAADLLARGLTAEDVRARLDAAGRVDSAGMVSDGAVQRPLVVHDPVRSVADLAALGVSGPGGSVPLGDVASISIEEVPDGTFASIDGQDAVLVAAWRAPSANAVALARGVARRVHALQASAGPGVRIDVVTDGSREVVAAIRELVLAAAIGLLLGTLILRAMLGRWAPTLALCAVVPASLLGAFAAFRVFGVPLDVVSLSGLALAAGMFVDNSIVVVESIESARARGADQPALTGARQVALAVVASCVTALVVFLPLLYLRGLARAFFGEQAFAVTASLSVSLLLALTLTPLLSARHAAAGRPFTPGLAAARAALEVALRRPRLALLLGALVTLATLLALLALPRELFPAGRPSRLRIAYELPAEASPRAARDGGRSLAEAATAASAAAPGTRVVVAQGADETGAGAARFTAGRIDVVVGDARNASDARAAIERALAATPAVRTRVAWRDSAFVESLARDEGGLSVVVASPDAARLQALAEDASVRCEAVAGARLVTRAAGLPRREIAATWDESRLVRLGVTRATLEPALRAAVGGFDAGRAEIADVEPAIRLMPTEPREPELVPVRIPATEAGGAARIVPAGALMKAAERPREPVLLRENGRPALRLSASRTVRDPEAVARAFRGIAVRPGETVALSGAALELQRAFRQLRLAAVLGLALCFLAVAVAYESLLLPLLNMSAVPVAFGGGLLLLAVTGQSLNVMSFIGLIILGGLATNHCVVLVDRIEQLRRAGVEETEAVRSAVTERYRPVLMTTLTMVLGMLPLALLRGDGEQLRRALATAVIGGLATSTLATIVLVPVMHRVLEPMRRRSA